MRRLTSFNQSMCTTVLNLLEAVYLRLRKIVVERVTVVKLKADNRGSDGTGCAESWSVRSSVCRCVRPVLPIFSKQESTRNF